jgi:hypothetical protein
MNLKFIFRLTVDFIILQTGYLATGRQEFLHLMNIKRYRGIRYKGIWKKGYALYLYTFYLKSKCLPASTSNNLHRAKYN